MSRLDKILKDTQEIKELIDQEVNELRYYSIDALNKNREKIITIQKNIDSFPNIRSALDSRLLESETYNIEYAKIHQEVLDLTRKFELLKSNDTSIDTLKNLIRIKQKCSSYEDFDEIVGVGGSVLNSQDDKIVKDIKNEITDIVLKILGYDYNDNLREYFTKN